SIAILLAGKDGVPIAQDPSGYAIGGIVVIGVDNSQGVWQYRTEPAGPWHNIGSPTDDRALLLFNDDDTSIRFVPRVGGRGTVGLRFRVWDGRGEEFALKGLAGDPDALDSRGEPQALPDAVHVNTVGSGGTSPFSAGVGVLTAVATRPRAGAGTALRPG